MNLLVDVGNTRTKYIFQDNDKESLVSTIENSHLNESWMTNSFKGVSRCVLSNVRHNAITNMFDNWSKENSIELRVVNSERNQHGVTTNYDNPESLGVDRWLALIGAKSIFPNENILIVDSGTATTVDVLTAQGEHLGGWILPGIELMTKSIVGAASKVQATPKIINSLNFASNTSDAVNNASYVATIGLIEQAKALCEKSRIKLDRIVLSGGSAESILDLIALDAIHVPNIVFEGLKKYIV